MYKVYILIQAKEGEFTKNSWKNLDFLLRYKIVAENIAKNKRKTRRCIQIHGLVFAL